MSAVVEIPWPCVPLETCFLLHSPSSIVRAQLLRKDILIHAGTGSGKTACAAGPHALPEMKGMVTLMVSPLIALQEEQMSQST